ncbi:hypothetical protein RZS08_36500, partial [Arthrospira platensis SPKY1]|nr:hypothetical protein [Arthrospira platensis SPKY1]
KVNELDAELTPYIPLSDNRTNIIHAFLYHMNTRGKGQQEYFKNIASGETLLKLFSVLRVRITDVIKYANTQPSPSPPIFSIQFTADANDPSRVKLYRRLSNSFMSDLNNSKETIYEDKRK